MVPKFTWRPRLSFIFEYGEKKVQEISEEELMEKEYPFALKYEEEFRENGFQNLVISKKGLHLA